MDNFTIISLITLFVLTSILCRYRKDMVVTAVKGTTLTVIIVVTVFWLCTFTKYMTVGVYEKSTAYQIVEYINNL